MLFDLIGACDANSLIFVGIIIIIIIAVAVVVVVVVLQ